MIDRSMSCASESWTRTELAATSIAGWGGRRWSGVMVNWKIENKVQQTLANTTVYPLTRGYLLILLSSQTTYWNNPTHDHRFLVMNVSINATMVKLRYIFIEISSENIFDNSPFQSHCNISETLLKWDKNQSKSLVDYSGRPLEVFGLVEPVTTFDTGSSSSSLLSVHKIHKIKSNWMNWNT